MALNGFIEGWERIINKISSELDLPIKTIDLNGNEIFSSNKPFYCRMIESNDKTSCRNNLKFYMKKLEGKDIIKMDCPHGAMNILLPIRIRNKLVAGLAIGALKSSSNIDWAKISSKVKIPEDELQDEYAKLGGENNTKILKILMDVLPNIIYENSVNKKKISGFAILREITRMVNSSLEIRQIMTEIIRFIVENKFADTCSVVTLKPVRRYTISESSLPKHYTAFEMKIINEVIKDKKTRGIPNISKDKRFNSKSNFNVYNSLITIPIVNKYEVLGTLNLYSQNIEAIKQHLEIFSIIADQAGIALANANQYQIMKTSANTDKLTGLYNRRYFMDVLDQEVARSRRFSHPISVAMLDIDHFKNYNDTNGHPKGDKLLTEMADIIKSAVRDVDTVGRYGGEEFIVVFPEIKPNEILSAADRIVKTVAKNKFFNGEAQPKGKVTISLGLLTCMDASLSPAELIKQADEALYQAKRTGRNKLQARVVLKKGMRPLDIN